MAQLVTNTEVKDRLKLPGVTLPAALTDAITDQYVDGATAEILRAMKRTTLPSAGLLRDHLDEVCLTLVTGRIKRDFFGLAGDVMEALRKQEASALASLANAKEDELTTTIAAKVVGGT